MGAYLDAPIKEKNSEINKNNMCAWGACSMQGWRVNMEDTHIGQLIDLPGGKKAMVFGVFDGHGGKEVAEYARDHFIRILKSTEAFQRSDFEKTLVDTFMNLDEEIKSKDFAMDTGSTSCVVIITDSKIICANAGDSRAVLAQNQNKAIGLSEDHKPDNLNEQKRIENAGHHVEDQRVDGNLALSRAFGDFQYKDRRDLSSDKQAVTAMPDVTTRSRSKDDVFLMIACDGIWDCLTNQELVIKINQKLANKGNKGDNFAWPVEEMLDEICAVNTEEVVGTDNMTAILIKLNNDGL